MYNYNGTGFYGLNTNDPVASRTQAITPHMSGNGHVHTNMVGLRSFSSATPDNASVSESYLPYQSEINKMMQDYAVFLSPTFWDNEQVTYESRSIKVVEFGGYKFVDLDPVSELFHGRTRDIGEICTYLYVQRYASWIKWTEELMAIDKEVMKLNLLKQELIYDMKVRVPAMVSYHTIIKEGSEIFGACGTPDFASITAADTVSFDVLILMKEQVRDHPYAAGTEVVVTDSISFDNLRKQAIDEYTTLGAYMSVPPALMSSYSNDSDMFTSRGVTVMRNRIIDGIPKNYQDTLTGYVNTVTDVGMAIIMNGKFGKQTGYSKNGVTDKITEKPFGTVDANDMLNQVASYTYRKYFGATVFDPTLCTVYYFAADPSMSCNPIGGTLDPYYENRNNDRTVRYNRFVRDTTDGISNEITFQAPTVVSGTNEVFLQVEVKYANVAKHVEYSLPGNAETYREDMDLLVEQYLFVIERDGVVISQDTLAAERLSTSRVYMAKCANVQVGGPGSLVAKIVHIQNDDTFVDTCSGVIIDKFGQKFIDDVTGTVVLRACATDGPVATLQKTSSLAEEIEMARQASIASSNDVEEVEAKVETEVEAKDTAKVKTKAKTKTKDKVEGSK